MVRQLAVMPKILVPYYYHKLTVSSFNRLVPQYVCVSPNSLLLSFLVISAQMDQLRMMRLPLLIFERLTPHVVTYTKMVHWCYQKPIATSFKELDHHYVSAIKNCGASKIVRSARIEVLCHFFCLNEKRALLWKTRNENTKRKIVFTIKPEEENK